MDCKELITFENEQIGEIRGFIKDGEPWFLAGQVCRCLGIKDAGQAVRQVEDRLRKADYKGAFSKRPLMETNGGQQKVIVIPEPFLYELIFASRKKKAIKFRAWVTSEVLPSLRRQGFYRMQGKLIRSSLTDTIKAKHDNPQFYVYSNYTSLINKSLGLDRKAKRDSLTADQLQSLTNRENLVKSLLDEGYVYKDIKSILENLSQMKAA